ncbi:hypothetical protein BHM03_00053769, partial [Ensete ventricosum]
MQSSQKCGELLTRWIRYLCKACTRTTKCSWPSQGAIGTRRYGASELYLRHGKDTWNLVKYPSRMKRVDIEDGTWSRGTELSLDIGVTQEWVDEGELPRERTKNRRWRRPYEMLAKATYGEVVVRFASDESLGRQHIGVMYHRERSQITGTSESHGGDLIIQRYDRSGWRVGLLQCSHSLKGARQVREQSR